LPKSHDWEHLSDLIQDFPPRRPITIEKSFELLRDRTKALEDFSIFEKFGEAFFSLPIKNQVEATEEVILAIHSILFKRILSNNGKYRSGDEPGGGRVSFGGALRAETRNRYTGSNPDEIPSCVADAIKQLFTKRNDKIENAVRFYQLFVLCHPFYDANGRIARMIFASYLSYYGYIVLWTNMLVKGKAQFIKRINRCHDRYQSQDKAVYEAQIGHFVDHVKKYIISKSDLGNLSEPE